LKYIDVRSKGPIHSTPTKWQKGLYGFLTVGGRYAWDKWESWLVGQSDGYEEVNLTLRLYSSALLTKVALAKGPVSRAHNGSSFDNTLGRSLRFLPRILGKRPIPDFN